MEKGAELLLLSGLLLTGGALRGRTLAEGEGGEAGGHGRK
jgi:hypothetical protein